MTSAIIFVVVFVDVFVQALGEICQDYGHTCVTGQHCCGHTCCITDTYSHGYKGFRWSVWNMWYFWFIVIFILMSCFGGCGYWRRRQLMLHQQQSMIHHQQSYEQYMGGATRNVYHGGRLAVPIYPTYDTSYPAAAPSVANGGQPEGAFPAPPPYNEVVTKPYFPPNKDEELPPYPGEFRDPYPSFVQSSERPYMQDIRDTYPGLVQTNEHAATMPSSGALRNDDGSVPGLPPYSPPSEIASANQQPASAFMPSNQHTAYSGPTSGGQDQNQSGASHVENVSPAIGITPASS